MRSYEIMQRIGEQLRTQDNRCTSDPVFIVQQRVRIWGVESSKVDRDSGRD